MDKREFIPKSKESIGNIRGYSYISSGLYEEKKSKFYSYIFKIEDKKKAEEILKNVREEYKDARHVVYAYVIGNEYKYSDDGEPSGTAGKMIYSLLEKQNITNILVIVIRYFGGILLGAGPLSRAYLKAVKSAEEETDSIEYIPKTICKLECEYNEEGSLKNILENTKAVILNVNYGEKIEYEIMVSEKDINSFNKYQKS